MPHKTMLKFKFKSGAKYFHFGPEKLQINLEAFIDLKLHCKIL